MDMTLIRYRYEKNWCCSWCTFVSVCACVYGTNKIDFYDATVICVGRGIIVNGVVCVLVLFEDER